MYFSLVWCLRSLPKVHDIPKQPSFFSNCFFYFSSNIYHLHIITIADLFAFLHLLLVWTFKFIDNFNFIFFHNHNLSLFDVSNTISLVCPIDIFYTFARSVPRGARNAVYPSENCHPFKYNYFHNALNFPRPLSILPLYKCQARRNSSAYLIHNLLVISA